MKLFCFSEQKCLGKSWIRSSKNVAVDQTKFEILLIRYISKNRLAAYSFIVFAFLFLGQSANAKEHAIPSLGVTAQIPENWKVEVRERKNRTMAFLKPDFEEVDSVFHCTIDRQVTPESTKGYTQKQINAIPEEKLFTAHDFST